jgi:hypothetical protein
MVGNLVRYWHAIIESPVFAAFVAGLYVSVFYVMANLTMLPGSSVFIVAFVLIVPVTIAVAFLLLLLHLLGKGAFAKPISIFVCTSYLLILMRHPLFDIHAVGEFFNQFNSTTQDAAKLVCFFAVAILLAYVFRNSVAKFTAVLGAMTIALIAGNMTLLAGMLIDRDDGFGSEMATSLQDITLSRSPNIYFILTDGYGSLAYMDEHAIDIGGFKSFLSSNDFRLYDEVFSNYHSTTNALPAMLNMDHHYYTLNELEDRESGEVRKTGRIIIGGQNNLVDLLRRNSYQVQYIHNWPYLLLHGCTADHCYGDRPHAGAHMLLGEILPNFTGNGETDYWVNRLSRYGERRPLEDSRVEVARLIDQNGPAEPIFQYIHVFAPTHAPDSQVGICDEVEQIAYYSRRVSEVNGYLERLIDDIVSRDPTAVIVLTGDHGPFIVDKCSRWTDLSTLSNYRDRAGVIMAIRWPEGYDGRYDEQITTTINTFKYVLAALTDDDADILGTVVCDDVYVMGRKSILKIVADGSVLLPPEHYTGHALWEKRHAPCQTSGY